MTHYTFIKKRFELFLHAKQCANTKALEMREKRREKRQRER